MCLWCFHFSLERRRHTAQRNYDKCNGLKMFARNKSKNIVNDSSRCGTSHDSPSIRQSVRKAHLAKRVSGRTHAANDCDGYTARSHRPSTASVRFQLPVGLNSLFAAVRRTLITITQPEDQFAAGIGVVFRRLESRRLTIYNVVESMSHRSFVDIAFVLN